MKTPLLFSCMAFAATLLPAAAPIASCSGNPDAARHIDCICIDEGKPHVIAGTDPSPELGQLRVCLDLKRFQYQQSALAKLQINLDLFFGDFHVSHQSRCPHRSFFYTEKSLEKSYQV